MSRTHKDKKWSLRYPENDYTFGTEKVEYTKTRRDWLTGGDMGWYTSYIYVDIPGAKKKKKRYEHGDWLWFQATPSWWTRLTMNRPKRRACRVWERQVLLQDIEDADCPDYGKQPHVYFW